MGSSNPNGVTNCGASVISKAGSRSDSRTRGICRYFKIAQAAVDELRILTAGAGGEVILLHQSDAQRRTGMLGPKRQIANDAADHQEVQQTGGPQSPDLIAAQVGYLSSSLAGESACTTAPAPPCAAAI
jgi:hypothetical protein